MERFFSTKMQINVATLKGPTGLGLLKLIEENTVANKYNISIFESPNDINAKLINGEIDIATIPTNMSSVIYNKAEKAINVAAINTLGVIYVLSNNDKINSILDLKGKKIFISGKGATPEYALKYILKQSNLDPQNDVLIEYESEHSKLEKIAALGEIDTVLIPEPFATQLLNKNAEYNIKLDIAKEWYKLQQNTCVCSPLTMGCIVARKEFIEKNELLFKDFLLEYENSVNFINSNIKVASELSEKYDIMPKQVAADAIPRCNMVFIKGDDMKSIISNFLKVIFEIDASSVGGRLPDEKFYYKK